MQPINTLGKGLLLEDTGQYLTWGDWMQKIVKCNNAKNIRTGDRLIIEWGQHFILGGLQVELTTTYLVPVLPFFLRRFKSVTHHVVGDQKSFEDFDRIANHLVKMIGEPVKKKGEVTENCEKEWLWQIGSTTLHLYLFEQHVFKLSFTIRHSSNRE